MPSLCPQLRVCQPQPLEDKSQESWRLHFLLVTYLIMKAEMSIHVQEWVADIFLTRWCMLPIEKHHYLGLNGLTIDWLCDVGQDTSVLWASVSPLWNGAVRVPISQCQREDTVGWPDAMWSIQGTGCHHWPPRRSLDMRERVCAGKTFVTQQDSSRDQGC